MAFLSTSVGRVIVFVFVTPWSLLTDSGIGLNSSCPLNGRRFLQGNQWHSCVPPDGEEQLSNEIPCQTLKVE